MQVKEVNVFEMGQLLYFQPPPEPPSPRVPVVTGLPGDPDFNGGISTELHAAGGVRWGVPPTFPTADTANGASRPTQDN